MSFINEYTVESGALDFLRGLGYQVLFGPEIEPGSTAGLRESFQDVILRPRLRDALARINPDVPESALADAFRKVTVPASPSLIENNRAFHTFFRDGVEVETRRKDGSIAGLKVWLADFANPAANDWLAVNQFTVQEGDRLRRADIVIFLNGLPVAVLELKNLADASATAKKAFQQLQTYKHEIPSLFAFNEALVASDGLEAKMGTLTADWPRFSPWRTIDGRKIADDLLPELQVLLQGAFAPHRLLDLVRNFVAFESQGASVAKKMAAYHQYCAVNAAVEQTLQAASPGGDRKVGVVWHTQGSGKSLAMLFYAGKIIEHPAMENPTIVVITDRNDLDEQLFGTFSSCAALLRQTPVQARSRDHLRGLLRVASGGVVFTTVQKFFAEPGEKLPALSERRNIVVIADEAHRSQYDFIDGFARHMRDALPNASFLAFTGTPLELADKDTRHVFGEYISIYDIQRAVEDHATVPIYYEGRLARLELKEDERPHIDTDFEEVTEGAEVSQKEKLKSKWARLEAMVGTEKRIGLLAGDLVRHFEQRLDAMDGKGMIVCMSRRICVDLYNALVRLRPEWASDEDGQGFLKVVMTGSAMDPPEWQRHIRTGERRSRLAVRFKDPESSFRLAIVRDMWLTGFDVPPLHTMYLDKPMRGHGLMQAIARVNRVYKDKEGGLVVDYLGVAEELKKALKTYTESGGKGDPVPDVSEAVAVMLEKYEVVRDMFHGFDYSGFCRAGAGAKMVLVKRGSDHIAGLDNWQERFLPAVSALSRAFALAVPRDEALAIADDVGFFQAVRATLRKATPPWRRSEEDMDSAIKQIVSSAVTSNEVVDIFKAAGLDQPNISILSDEFLEEVRNMPERNLALAALQRLLADEIKGYARRNLVTSRRFSEMLEEAIRRYQNRSLEAAEVIAELIKLAKELREAHGRGEELGLSDDELAFYDALEVNDSAVKVLGEPTLKDIARELVNTVRRNTSIDWNLKESVRAKLRVLVKRILKKYGYPPDKQEQATQTVLEQAELLTAAIAA